MWAKNKKNLKKTISILVIVTIVIAIVGYWISPNSNDKGTSHTTVIAGIEGIPLSDIPKGAITEIYRYEWFDVLPVSYLKAPPLSLTVDDGGRVWINQEFHIKSFQMIEKNGTVRKIDIPSPAGPGPFASFFEGVGDRQTNTSALGEKIIVDPLGRIWLTEGGFSLYQGEFPNHSRIIMYNPETSEFRVYNVPGDRNEVIGIAWDNTRNLIWFAEGGNGAKITSFNPDTTPYNNTFDFSTSLDDQVCPEDGPFDGCYRIYELPRNGTRPSNLVVDNDGFVWATLFWGNSIVRLDPETGAVVDIPLSDEQSKADIIFGGCPWDIILDGKGNLVLTEFVDLTVDRFRMSEVNNPKCLKKQNGINPCIEEINVLPGLDYSEGYGVHSLAYDLSGNLWFTTTASHIENNNLSVGYITPDWEQVVMLPPLRYFPANGPVHSAGIAVDKKTGDIWFSEYERKRIGKLHLLNSD